MENRKKGVHAYGLLILLQSVLYGIGDPLSKSAYEALSVYSLLSARYLIALFALILLGRKRIWNGIRRCPVRIWLAPSMCIALCYVLDNVALQLTSATSVAFLRSLSIVMTPLLAFVFYRSRYRWIHIPIQAMIVLGLYLLCGMGGLSGFGLGEVCALMAALLMAGALVFGGQALHRVDAITLSTVQTAASAMMALICAFLLEGGIHLKAASIGNWGVIIYLAICCTLAGYMLQNTALRRLPSRTVALIQCICPVMTALFSFLFLGERMNGWGMLGAAIILLCVIAENLLGEK